MVFTVVFGMGTGVTPYRIATGNIWLFCCLFVRAGNFAYTLSVLLCLALSSVVHSFLQVTLPSPQVTRYAPHLVPGRVPYTNLLPSQSLHASMQACSFKRLLQEL